MGLLTAVAAVVAAFFLPALLAPSTACTVGNMANRLQARVPDDLKLLYFDAASVRVGLGNGAIGGWNSLGDAVALDGQLWLRTTHRDSPHYFSLVRNRYFQTNAFVATTLDARPMTEVTLDVKKTAKALLADLAAQHPRGVLAAGYLKFRVLQTIALSKAPIDGGALLKQAASYYTRPMESARDVWTYAVLLAGKADKKSLKPMLEGARDNGYFFALALHGAPGNVRKPPLGSEAVNLGEVVGLSEVAEGHLELFALEKISTCAGVTKPKEEL